MPTDEPAVTLEVARAEAAARAVRLQAVVVPLWKASRAWTVAIVLAAFPFLFMLDDWVEFELSPVLPGLAVLAVIIIVLPFILVELRARRYLRKSADWQELHALRAVGVGRAAMGVAAVWLLLWFMVGT